MAKKWLDILNSLNSTYNNVTSELVANNVQNAIDELKANADGGTTVVTSHIDDATIHFVEGDISHTNIQDIGTNTHTQIDTHINDATVHFTEGSIDHANIQNIGTNTHNEIDQTLANHAQSLVTLQTGKEPILDAVTNDGTALIGYENGDRNWEMVVKNHSDQTDYEVNDIVNMGGHFYTCTIAHEAETFDPNKWEVTVNPIGFAIKLNYNWSGSIAGDPGSGNFSVNNADPSLATVAFISAVTNASNTADFVWISAQEGDVFGFEEITGNKEFVYFVATGAAIDRDTYIEIPFSYGGGAGIPEDGRRGIASFAKDPSNKMPIGGTTGQSQVKSSDNNYDTEWATRLANVVEDTSPELGGNLATKGNYISITDVSDTLIASVKDGDIGAVFYRTVDGLYNPEDGAVAVSPGTVTFGGSNVTVNALQAENDKQVYCTSDGILYGIDPPEPVWIENDTDTGNYALTTLDAWVNMTGLFITLPEDVEAAEPVNIRIRAYITNASNHGGSVAFNVSANSAAPSGDGASYNIVEGYAGYIIIHVTYTSHGALTAGQTVNVFANRVAEDNSNFAPVLSGSTEEHALSVSVEGGGTGVTSHPDLTERSNADQHPTSAITGLDTALSGKIDTTNPVVAAGTITEDVYELGGISGTWDLDPDNGSMQSVTAAHNIIFADEFAVGQAITLRIHDGELRTITWPTITWVGGSAPTLTAADEIVIWKDEAGLKGSYVGSVA